MCALFFIILLDNISDMSHIVSRVTLLAKSGNTGSSLVYYEPSNDGYEISDIKTNKGQVSSKQRSHDLSLVSLMSDPVCGLSMPLSLCGNSKNKGNVLL